MTKIREVVVASDPTNFGALVGHVGESQFPIGGPDGAGHTSSGPNPYDLLSASLAACTAMSVRYQARRGKLPLERLEVGVNFHRGAQGERDSFVRTLVLGEDSTHSSAHSCWKQQTSVPSAKFSGLVQISARDWAPLLPTATQAPRPATRMIWLYSRSQISLRIERLACRRSLHRRIAAYRTRGVSSRRTRDAAGHSLRGSPLARLIFASMASIP